MKFGNAILLACAGVGLGWFGSAQFGTRNEQSGSVSDTEDSPVYAASEVIVRSESTPVPDAPSDRPGELFSTAEIFITDVEYLPSGGGELESSASNSGLVAETSNRLRETPDAPSLPEPTTQRGNSFVAGQLSDLPASAAASAVDMAETLLSDTQIVCELQDWRGGPLVVDLVDYFGPGTARMSGALSAPEMQFEVRMEITTDGLHFSGLTSNGNFLALTIFGVADEFGRYAAVHSRHVASITRNSVTSGYFGEQWYGGCL